MKKKFSYLLIVSITVIVLFGCTKKETIDEQNTVTEEVTTTEHKHDYKEEVVAAACGKEGSKIFICTICNDSYSEIIPALEHSYNLTNIINPTCTSKGTKTYTCENCSNSYLEEVEPTGHSYNKTITKNATCSSEGLITYTCSQCNNSYTESIAKLEHSWIAATCTTAKTCYVCGTTSGSELGHNEGSNGCCTRCGEQLTLPLEYTLAAYALKNAYDGAKFPSTVQIETAYYLNTADETRVVLYCSAENSLGGKGTLYSSALKTNNVTEVCIDNSYYIALYASSKNMVVSFDGYTKIDVQKCYDAYNRLFSN